MTNRTAQSAAKNCSKYIARLNLTHNINIIFRYLLAAGCAQHGKQFTRKLRLEFGILAAPGAALDFKIVTKLRFLHLIEIDEEFSILVLDQPALAIFLDGDFRFGFEVFTVETQGLRGRRKIATARQQHLVFEFAFALLTDQRQPGADVRHSAFDVIDEIIFTVAQTSLRWIVEEEVDIVFAIMPLADHVDFGLLQRLDDRVCVP